MRKKSKTYLQWKSFRLSEKNRLELIVPKGCANAYLTLKKKTWIIYFHSQFYSKGFEKVLNIMIQSLNLTGLIDQKSSPKKIIQSN